MADELINLVEYAKGTASSDALASGMIETFATQSDILSTISFKGVTQGQNTFMRETSEPAVNFRGLNEEPEISYGTQERFQDVCAPISGLIEYDRIKKKRYGERQRIMDMKGQMKRASRTWTDEFITGDITLDPKGFNGLKTRCVATDGVVDGSADPSRLYANSVASGGAPLSLGVLDLAVQLVEDPTHLLVPRRMHGRFATAARDPDLSNARAQITNDMDSNLGRRVMRFGDLELLWGYNVSRGSAFLPFDEVAYGGGSAVTSSVYIVSFSEDGICGIQSSAPEYVPVTTDRGVYERDLFEWDSGITWEREYSAMRVSSITDAKIVA